jgi:hypothetical protein
VQIALTAFLKKQLMFMRAQTWELIPARGLLDAASKVSLHLGRNWAIPATGTARRFERRKSVWDTRASTIWDRSAVTASIVSYMRGSPQGFYIRAPMGFVLSRDLCRCQQPRLLEACTAELCFPRCQQYESYDFDLLASSKSLETYVSHRIALPHDLLDLSGPNLFAF